MVQKISRYSRIRLQNRRNCLCFTSERRQALDGHEEIFYLLFIYLFIYSSYAPSLVHDPHFALPCTCLRSTEKLEKKYARSVGYSRINWERTQVTTSCKEYSKPCNQAILAASSFQAWRLHLQWLL